MLKLTKKIKIILAIFIVLIIISIATYFTLKKTREGFAITLPTQNYVTGRYFRIEKDTSAVNNSDLIGNNINSAKHLNIGGVLIYDDKGVLINLDRTKGTLKDDYGITNNNCLNIIQYNAGRTLLDAAIKMPATGSSALYNYLVWGGNTGNITHSLDSDNTWWEYDFGRDVNIAGFEILPRAECCAIRSNFLKVKVFANRDGLNRNTPLHISDTFSMFPNIKENGSGPPPDFFTTPKENVSYFYIKPKSIPTTSTIPPTTSTIPPTTSTIPPTTSTIPPTTSTKAPTTSTIPPTTSTIPPTTSTMAPSTSTMAPSTSTMAPSTSTMAPTTSTMAPTTSTIPPTTSTIPPTTSTIPPTTSTIPPTTSTMAQQSSTSTNPLSTMAQQSSTSTNPLSTYTMAQQSSTSTNPLSTYTMAQQSSTSTNPLSTMAQQSSTSTNPLSTYTMAQQSSTSTNPLSTMAQQSSTSSTSTTSLNSTVPQITATQMVQLLNNGANLDTLTSSGLSMNAAYKAPSTNIVQTDFSGTTNIYSPYLYYNKGVNEKFNGSVYDSGQQYYKI